MIISRLNHAKSHHIRRKTGSIFWLSLFTAQFFFSCQQCSGITKKWTRMTFFVVCVHRKESERKKTTTQKVFEHWCNEMHGCPKTFVRRCVNHYHRHRRLHSRYVLFIFFLFSLTIYGFINKKDLLPKKTSPARQKMTTFLCLSFATHFTRANPGLKTGKTQIYF